MISLADHLLSGARLVRAADWEGVDEDRKRLVWGAVERDLPLICSRAHHVDISGISFRDPETRSNVPIITPPEESVRRLPWPMVWMEASGKYGGRLYRVAICLEELVDDEDKAYGWTGFVVGQTDQIGQPLTVSCPLILVDGYELRTMGKFYKGGVPDWMAHRMEDLWDALLLLHCRNVSEVRVEPPDGVRRKRTKKLGRPPVVFHRLVVEVKKPRALHTPKGEKNEAEGVVRQHVTRGSFATYTEEAPLFGKLVGTFWRQAHVKGNPELGRVHSIHALERPL